MKNGNDCATRTLRIAYRAGGPQDGRPVILLHGWPDDATTWDAIAPDLHQVGRRTFAPFLRGFGPTRFQSDLTPRSGEIAAMAQDVLDFADALGLGRFGVAGHDWGARIAYLLAATQPQRIERCAALSLGWQPGPLPSPGFEQARAFWYQWYMATGQGADTVRERGKAFARLMWDTWSPPGWFDDPTFDRVAMSFENPDWAAVTLHAYRVRWGAAEPDPTHAALARRALDAPGIRVPTLVIHGGDDRCVLSSTSEGRDPHFGAGYERQVLEGVGHFPTREAPQRVGASLAAFFGRAE